MSCSSILHLYKLNIHKRNRATLLNWEEINEPKDFYESQDIESFNNAIETCKILNIAHIVLKSKDKSPAMLAVGPINSKRAERVTKNLKLVE